jgi:conjugative transposon TraK protein
MIKNIESKIRLATTIAIGSFVANIIICTIVSLVCYSIVIDSRKSIYLLDNNIPILAKQSGLEMNRPVEYKADVDLFHNIFFSLTPDDKQIEYQMKRAMYLVDESGVQQYNNLKEKGYFNSIMSSSSVLTIQTDSIYLDYPKKYFRFYGKQKIDRRSSTVTRSLITEGYLKDIPRSENNPHGVIIVNWKTVENKDIDNVQKNQL